MTTRHPLIQYDRLENIVGFYQREPVTAKAFLHDVTAVAARLPSRRYIVNLCEDRYRFAVALGAALIREQVSLLPPNNTPGTLDQLAAEFPDLYCLHDGTVPASSLLTEAYPALSASQPTSVTVPCFPADQPAVVLFTSGSTGRSTPHAKCWGSLVHSSLAAGARLGVASLAAGATIIGTVPHQHSYGLESTVLLALQHGMALHGARPFYPGDISASIAETPRPRILVTTPFHLRASLADCGDLPGLDLLISATAPLAPQLAAEAEARFGAPLLEIYGCSEAGQLAVRRTVEDPDWRCLETVELRQDAAGTWASGATIEGEVLLNDAIELLGPSRFRLHGRTADHINIAGKRASLAHLNYHLNSIAGVVDGVFMMPEETGQGVARLMAFVVAPELSAEAILSALRERIDAAFLPRPLLFVDALPRNVAGKLPREAILRLAKERT